MEILVNTTKKKPLNGAGRANPVSKGINSHTIQGKDLRIMQPIPGQSGLSLVLKLK